jgi:hypothetical protein
MRSIQEKKKLNSNEEVRLEKALIRLIGSTRRSRRSKNLIEVAKELAVAEKLLGSKKIIAEKIGISEEMLREFESVKKLSNSVKEVIINGRLTSVDVAYRLSMLPAVDQLKVAKAYIEGGLNTKDIRDIVTIFKRNPKSDIDTLIDRIKSSKDIIQYVIKFRILNKQEIRLLKEKFSKILGDENIISFEVNGKIAKLVINEKGQKILQEEANKYGITKRKLIKCIVDQKCYDKQPKT